MEPKAVNLGKEVLSFGLEEKASGCVEVDVANLKVVKATTD